ncbi:MAG: succinylglutamate desuccinylase/aspartoacylase family protein [Parvularculaceae bacterium]
MKDLRTGRRAMLRLSCCLSFLVQFALSGLALAGPDICDALADTAAGTRTDLTIDVAVGDDDPDTFIPITVLKGATAGPTVLMTAGVHGYEFAPILAAARLAEELDPEELSGDVVLVRIAHVAAFEARSPYVNPYDRKNLNRSFPGDPNGSQTERVAAALSAQVMPAADFVLDVHSGDGAEWLEAFIGVYGGRLATGYAKAFNFAEAMGFPNIIRYKMETQVQIDQGRSLNRQAVAQGAPTILVEIGQNGGRDPAHVTAIVNGVKRGLASLDMLKDPPAQSAKVRRYFDDAEYVSVERGGVWTPVEARGRDVAVNETIGVVTNYKGERVETVKAPVGGYALYGLAGPPVRKGESVVTIALPSTRKQLLSEAENE